MTRATPTAIFGIAVGLAIALTSACGKPSVPVDGCVDEAPAELGQSCTGDGECGRWLSCAAEVCELPAAVLGEGGENVSLIADGETVATLRVEVARSDIARTRGLGHRPCIADGWGMLIEFPTTDEQLIETNTMRFDLDIAMIGEDGVIHTVHRDAPAGGKALYGGELPTKSVLEVPAGSVDIAVGQHLVFD